MQPPPINERRETPTLLGQSRYLHQDATKSWPWVAEHAVGPVRGSLDPWSLGCKDTGLLRKNPEELGMALGHWPCDAMPEEDLSGLLQDVPGLSHGSLAWLSASRLHFLDTSRDSSSDVEVASVCASLDSSGLLPGVLGDRWLLAAFAALTSSETGRMHIRHCLPAWEPDIASCDGPYELHLHDPNQHFVRVSVRINDRVPCCLSSSGNGSSWRPVFLGNLRPETWPMLLEKAIALLLGGSFAALCKGHGMPLAWAMITGETQSSHMERTWPVSGISSCWNDFQFTDPFGTRNCERDAFPVSDDVVWQRVRLACQDQKLAACHFRPDDLSCSSEGKAMTAAGLLAGHGYILRSVVQLADVHASQTPETMPRLVLLQNPWQACSTWSGAWANEDARWQGQFAATLQKIHSDIFPETTCSTAFAASSFWMDWEDLVQHAESIILLELPPVAGYGLPSLLSTKTPLEAAGGTWALVGPDLWQDLSQQDPDFHQSDLSSWPDGMSDKQFPLDSRVFPKSAVVKWVSASRIHRLMRYAEDTRGNDGSTWWANVAMNSAGNAAGQVCSVILPWVMRAGLGNRWLCAAVAGLSQLRWPLEAAMVKCPARPLEARDGSYTLILHDPHKSFRRTEVLINDRVPCFPLYGNARGRPSGWRPCFASSLYRQMWPMLLEKSVAKILGGYHCLDGHSVPLAWAILTGVTVFGALFPWPCTAPMSAPEAWGEGAFDLEKRWDQYEFQPRCRNEFQSNVVQQRLRLLLEALQPVACCFRKPAEEGDEEEADDLVPGHAYALLELRAAMGQQQLRLLGPWQGGEGTCSAAEQLQLRRARELAKDSHHEQVQAAGDETHFWLPWEEFETRVSCIFFSTSFWAREPGGPGETTKQVFEEDLGCSEVQGGRKTCDEQASKLPWNEWHDLELRDDLSEAELKQRLRQLQSNVLKRLRAGVQGCDVPHIHRVAQLASEVVEDSLPHQRPPPVVRQEQPSVVQHAAGQTPLPVVRQEAPAVVQQAAGRTPYQPPAAAFQRRTDSQERSCAASDRRSCEQVADEIVPDATSAEEEQAAELGRWKAELQEVRDLLRRPGRLPAEQAESKLLELQQGAGRQLPQSLRAARGGERLSKQINAVWAQIRMRLAGDSSEEEPCQTGPAAACTESFEDLAAEGSARETSPDDEAVQLGNLEARLREVRAVLRKPGRLLARERAEEAQSMLAEVLDGLDHLQLCDTLQEEGEQLRGQIEALQGQAQARLLKDSLYQDIPCQAGHVSLDTENFEELATELSNVAANSTDLVAKFGSIEAKLLEVRNLLCRPDRLRAEQAHSMLADALNILDCLQPQGNLRDQAERLRGQINVLQTHVHERLSEASWQEDRWQTSHANSDAVDFEKLAPDTSASVANHEDQAVQLGSLEAKLQEVRTLLCTPDRLRAEQAHSILVEASTSLDCLQPQGNLRDQAERLRGQINVLQTRVRETLSATSCETDPWQTSHATSDEAGFERLAVESSASAASHEDQAMQLGSLEAKLQEVRDLLSGPVGLQATLRAEQAQPILVAALERLDSLQLRGNLREHAERIRGQIDALRTHLHLRLSEDSTIEDLYHTSRAISDTKTIDEPAAELSAEEESPEGEAVQLASFEAKLQEVRALLRRPGRLRARERAEQARLVLVEVSGGLDSLQLCDDLQEEVEQLRGQIDALQGQVDAKLAEGNCSKDFAQTSCVTADIASSSEIATGYRGYDENQEDFAAELRNQEARLQEVQGLLESVRELLNSTLDWCKMPGKFQGQCAESKLTQALENINRLRLQGDLRAQGERLHGQINALQAQVIARLSGDGSSKASCATSDTMSSENLAAELGRWEAKVQEIQHMLRRPGDLRLEVIQAGLVEVSEGLDNMKVQGDLKNRRLRILNLIDALEAELAARAFGGGSAQDQARIQSTPSASASFGNLGADGAVLEARLLETSALPRDAAKESQMTSTQSNDRCITHSTPSPSAHSSSAALPSKPSHSTENDGVAVEAEEPEHSEDSDEYSSNTESEASSEEAAAFAEQEASSSSSGSSEDEAQQVVSKRSSFRMRVRKESGLFQIFEERERAVLVIRRLRITGLKGQQLRPYVRTEFKTVFRTTPVAAGNNPSWDGVDWIMNPTCGSMRFLLKVMHKPFYSFSNTGWTHKELGQAVCDFQMEGASPGRHHTLKLQLLAGEKGEPTGACIEIELIWFDSTSSENMLSRMRDAGAYPEYELRHAELKPQLPGPGLLLLRLSLAADARAEVELGSTKRSVSGKSRKLVRWLRKKGADEHEVVMNFKAGDEQLNIELLGEGSAHLFFRDLVPGRWSMVSTNKFGAQGSSGTIRTSIYWLPEVGHRPGPLEGSFGLGNGNVKAAQLEVEAMKVFGLKPLASGSSTPVIHLRIGSKSQISSPGIKREETYQDGRRQLAHWDFPGVMCFRLEPGDCQLDLEVKTKGSSFRRAARLGSLSVSFRSRELGGRRDLLVEEPLVDGSGARISLRLSWQSPTQRLSDISVTDHDAQQAGLTPTSYRHSRFGVAAPAKQQALTDEVISSEAQSEQDADESSSLDSVDAEPEKE